MPKLKKIKEHLSVLEDYIINNEDLPFFNDQKLKELGFKYMESNAYRYAVTLSYLSKFINNHSKLIDFGSFPGQLQKLIFEKFNIKSTLVGLGLNNNFKSYFSDFSILETNLENKQRFNKIKETYNLATALNIIEHMEYPNALLDSINYFMQPNGILILTTDNISSLNSIKAIIRGKSPNENLTKSKIFFNGDWRPHVRIFSKDELTFLLNYSGFSVIEHSYFDHKSREYKLIDDKLKLKKKSLRNKFVDLLKDRYSYTKDHHIFVAKKRVSYSELNSLRPLPTSSLNKWIDTRKSCLDYKIFKLTN